MGVPQEGNVQYVPIVNLAGDPVTSPSGVVGSGGHGSTVGSNVSASTQGGTGGAGGAGAQGGKGGEGGDSFGAAGLLAVPGVRFYVAYFIFMVTLFVILAFVVAIRSGSSVLVFLL